jgi:hypothetical protein
MVWAGRAPTSLVHREILELMLSKAAEMEGNHHNSGGDCGFGCPARYACQQLANGHKPKPTHNRTQRFHCP